MSNPIAIGLANGFVDELICLFVNGDRSLTENFSPLILMIHNLKYITQNYFDSLLKWEFLSLSTINSQFFQTLNSPLSILNFLLLNKTYNLQLIT